MKTLTLKPPKQTSAPPRVLGIALLGCGTVGGSLVELLASRGELIQDRAGVAFAIRKVLVRDLGRDRGLPDGLLTEDAEDVLAAPDVDVVVELLGGLNPAYRLVRRALVEGRHVVTANKALMAEHGPELLGLARANGVGLGFSASVCGAVPVLRAIGAGLAGNRVERVCGILNGTCNYILTRMAEGGVSYADALQEAQAAGFAEADPTLDVGGHDAAQKLALLAGLAFRVARGVSEVHVEGIQHITPQDIRAAARLGGVIKHIATAGPDGLTARPELLPLGHPLAQVRNEYNGVLVRGDAAGELAFLGAGAGGVPTAGSVLADLLEIGSGPPVPPLIRPAVSATGPNAAARSREFYLRFPVVDAPGVIGLIATALGNRGISIRHAEAVLQPSAPGSGNVIMLVHRCNEEALGQALEHLAHLPVIRGRPVALAVPADVPEAGDLRGWGRNMSAGAAVGV